MASSVSILFVCLGNICRSPAGEAILKDLVRKRSSKLSFHIESCGLGSWHVGSLPDSRICQAALKRGIRLESRAQQFRRSFFDQFDYILAADRSVMEELRLLAKKDKELKKLYMMNDFSSLHLGEDVPDPYYGGEDGFEHTLDMLEDACRGLLKTIFEGGG